MRITVLAIGMAVLLGAGVALAADAKPDAAAPAADKAAATPQAAVTPQAVATPQAAATPQVAATPQAAATPSGKKAAKGKASGPSDEQIADQLKQFCVKWMGFLETRERDNKKGIKWEKKPTGVAGHYVGYSKEYDCVMKERSSNGTPVAVILYKEFVYEQVGASQMEAEQDAADVVDATEVTEIFRYGKGEWVY